MRAGAVGTALLGTALLAAALVWSSPAVAATRRRPATTGVRQVPTGALTEVSGCARSRRTPDRVWLHNDSGDRARLFWLDLRTLARGAVDVAGATAIDWEDMAPGPGGTLVVADIGDNARRRRHVTVYRLREPTTAAAGVTATAESFTYEDGPHDAEALVVDPADGTAYVVTKEPTGRAGVYWATGGVLRRTGTVTITGEFGLFPNLVTAADALPDGSGVVVRTYQRGYLLRRSKKPAPFASAFAAAPQPFALPAMLQAEALCVTADGRSAVTAGESVGAPAFPLAMVALPVAR